MITSMPHMLFNRQRQAAVLYKSKQTVAAGARELL